METFDEVYRKGRKRRTLDDDDGDFLKDGEYLSVGMMFMDGLQKSVAASRPGFVTLDDADAKPLLDSYQRYQDRLNNAWRGNGKVDPPPAPVVAPPAPVPLVQDTSGDYYAGYDQRLSERWRSA